MTDVFKSIYRVEVYYKMSDGCDEDYYTNVFISYSNAQLFYYLLPNDGDVIDNIIKRVFPDIFTSDIDAKIMENDWNNEQEAIDWFRSVTKSDYPDEVLYEILRFRVLSVKYWMLDSVLYHKSIDELRMFNNGTR